MSSPNDLDLAGLVAAVRRVDPQGSEDDRVVATAMWTGRARHRRRVAVRVAMSGLAAAAVVALAWLGSARDPELLEIQLASGDALRAVAGSQFRIESEVAGARRLRLDRGAMLFDVRPLGPGERFEVVTPDSVIAVVGTVFAVETTEAGTEVSVYEGRVRVRDARGEREITPRSSPQGHGDGIAHLDEAGLAAAEQRAARAEASSPVSALSARPDRVAELGEELTASSESREASSSSARPTTRSETGATEPRAVEPGAVEPRAVEPRAVEPRAVEPSTTTSGRARSRDAPSQAPATPEELRAWIAEGRTEDALELARGRSGATWRFVEADALRALGRAAEAADAYEHAASDLRGFEQANAAYLAANLRLTAVREPEAALRILDAFAIDREGAPLRERALIVRAQALEALGRTAEIAEVAAAYVSAFPHGSRAAWMQAHLDR